MDKIVNFTEKEIEKSTKKSSHDYLFSNKCTANEYAELVGKYNNLYKAITIQTINDGQTEQREHFLSLYGKGGEGRIAAYLKSYAKKYHNHRDLVFIIRELLDYIEFLLGKEEKLSGFEEAMIALKKSKENKGLIENKGDEDGTL